MGKLNGFDIVVLPALRGNAALVIGRAVFLADQGSRRLNRALARRALALAGHI